MAAATSADAKPEFTVEVRLPGGEVRTESFPAETPGLATRAVEAMHPCASIVRVVREWTPASRCHKCGTILFTGDYSRQTRYGRACLSCS